MKRDLEHRRTRVRRIVAKRPAITIVATHAPKPASRERLLDLLVELLDNRDHSGRKG